MSTHTECSLHFFRLYPFPWDPNMRQEERVKIDVERREIVRPNTSVNSPSCWGIFYDPQLGRATFFPPPTVAVVPQATVLRKQRHGARSVRGTSSMLDVEFYTSKRPASHRPSTGCMWYEYPYPTIPVAPLNMADLHTPRDIMIRAAIESKTRSPSQINDDLATLKKRKDDAQGLHYVLMDASPSQSGQIIEERCLRLLLDTACPVTWVYTRQTKILNLTRNKQKSLRPDDPSYVVDQPLPRPKGARFYTGDITEISSSVEELRFADKFTAWFKLYQGFARIIKEGARDAFQIDDLRFALCVAATIEKSPEQMDGILGMAQKAMSFGDVQTSDLFAFKFSQEEGLSGPPSFKIALGDDEDSSWLIIDSLASDTSIKHMVPHLDWSVWTYTIKTMRYGWIFNVFGFTTPSETHLVVYNDRPHCVPFMLDTASVLTYLPTQLFDALVKEMDASVTPSGLVYCSSKPDHVAKLKRTPLTINFEKCSIPVGGLDTFLMEGQGPTEDTKYCAFKVGCLSTHASSTSEPLEISIFGNLFLRKFVVEFQYLSNISNIGRMRMALRE